ncbi:uncharacterized protein LOC112689032 [Sipha flava]|uniref:Uncharacterized protein LOC112689032 n=1 Tax=Sipha flava TaxID=143950 RepID=A0A8B8G4Z6_9HEMI|nr:uncharacterized protein LOC112689032 [Sipha flava]
MSNKIGKFLTVLTLSIKIFILKKKFGKLFLKKVGRTDEDCKKRWRNIRDTYMKQKKKLSTGSATSEKVNRTLSYLSFMDSVEYERKTTSNVKNQENDNSLSTAEDGDDTQNHTLNDEKTFESPNTCSDLPSISSYAGKRIRSKEDKISAILSKRSKETDNLLSKIQAQNEILVSSIGNQHEDNVDLFFKSISTSVKKLLPRAINEAKLQILTLVSHLEDKYSNFQPQVGPQPQVYQPQYFDYQFPSQQSHVAQPSPSPSTSSSSHGFELYKTHNYEDDN